MANNQGVKVIGSWASPFSRRVEIALKMKGVEYELIEEDVLNKSPLLLKYNPVHEKIPVLLHNGNSIAESIVILEYIDETWNSGTPILPKDPHQRATARFWAKFIDEKYMPTLFKACRGTGQEQEKAIEESSELLQTLENELKGKKFFGGDRIGLADIVANSLALWSGILQEIYGLELLTKEKFPKLSEWSDEYLNCSIIKESLPPRDELFSRLQAFFQSAGSYSPYKKN